MTEIDMGAAVKKPIHNLQHDFNIECTVYGTVSAKIAPR